MTSARMRVETSPPATSMALMVTRRCNMRCGHCSVESSPDIQGEPTEAELLDRVRQAAGGDVRAINLTGGEPMLRPRTVLRLVRTASRLGVATSLTTNGSWGRTAARAWHGVHALRRAGLGSLAVSVDRYHEEFQGPTPAFLIARAAEKAGLPVRISLVVPAGPGGDDGSPPWSRRSRVFAARVFDSTGSSRSVGRGACRPRQWAARWTASAPRARVRR